MTRLDLVEELTPWFWYVFIKFDTQKNIEICTVLEGKNVRRKQCN